MGGVNAEDGFAIQQVIARYCRLLDAQAWDRLDEVFVESAVVDTRPVGFGTHEGLPAIVEFWTRFVHPDAHHQVNILIEAIDDDTAHVMTKGFFPRGRGISGGDYDLDVVRTEKGWRISRLRYERRWELPEQS